MNYYNGNTAGNAPGTKTAGQLYEERMSERKRLLGIASANVQDIKDLHTRECVAAIIAVLERVN